MALSIVGHGSPVFGTTTATPTYPAGYTATAGDHAVAFVISKPSGTALSNVPVHASGWALKWTATVGTGTAGAGTGPVQLSVFERPVTAGMTLSPFTVAGTGACLGVHVSICRWAAGTESLSVDVAVGSRTTAATAYSVTGNRNVGFTTGDVAMLLTGLTGTTPMAGATTLTATGATMSTPAEVWDTSTANGNDVSYQFHTSSCTAGTSTAAPVFGITLSSSTGATGGTLILRLRATPTGINGRGATNTEASASATLTAPLPAGTTTGDVSVAQFAFSGTPGSVTTPPSGWSTLISPTNFGGNANLVVYYRVWTAGVTPSNPAITVSTSSRLTAQVESYFGVDNTTPIDVAASVYNPAGASPMTTPTVPGISIVTAGARLIGGQVGDASAGSIVPWPPPEMDAVATSSSTGGGRSACYADEVRPAAGATGATGCSTCGSGAA